MHKIDPDTLEIELTRGDLLPLTISALNDDKTNYTFRKGDIIRFKAFRPDDCACVEIQKDIIVETPAKEIDMDIEETSVGPIFNEPLVLWYEVELNPDTRPQTIIGYEKETGGKILTITPEGGKKHD